MTGPTQVSPHRGLSVLEQTPGVLKSLLLAANEEDLQWRPAADRWSVTMVLAHLADVEVHGFRGRFTAMLNHEDPFLASYDPGRLFQARSEFDPRAELETFEKERRETLALLRNLPVGAEDRTGRHEEFGQITLGELLNEFAFHDLGHMRQVIEVYRSRVFYPRMGAFQGIYRINP